MKYSYILFFLQLGALAAESFSESSYRKLQDYVQTATKAELTNLVPSLSEESSGKLQQSQVYGNLRKLSNDANGGQLYVLIDKAGHLYILAEPTSPLEQVLEDSLLFTIRHFPSELSGAPVSYAYLQSTPTKPLIRQLLTYTVILVLFSFMVGMGLTVSRADFKNVLQTPKSLILGPLCQFGLLPLLAFSFGSLTGFDDNYPFLFIGLILIAACPGGVTSNLLTYLAKGDVALSVSLTTISTIASIFLTPLILSLYIQDIPDVFFPFDQVVQHILFFMLVPLFIGMLIRYRAKPLAIKLQKQLLTFSVLALVALVFLGLLLHIDILLDTGRFGLSFYGTLFMITFSAMVLSAVFARILGINNSQSRTISLETGLQNAALAMTMAILLQDRLGDYHSSMFAVSGLFGLCMYIPAALMLWLFEKTLPVKSAH